MCASVPSCLVQRPMIWAVRVRCSGDLTKLFPRLSRRFCTVTILMSTLKEYTKLSIRWPINFCDFLRLDRLDRFAKIIKSIFSKFWKRDFEKFEFFFSVFRNFLSRTKISVTNSVFYQVQFLRHNDWTLRESNQVCNKVDIHNEPRDDARNICEISVETFVSVGTIFHHPWDHKRWLRFTWQELRG